MNIHNQENCCDTLFDDFEFQDLQSAELVNKLPNQKGVYVIRVKQLGSPIIEIIEKVKRLLENLNWELIKTKVVNRIKRLEKNSAVAGQLAMWAEFLCQQQTRDLLSEPYPFLKFGNLQGFDVDFGIYDNVWSAGQQDDDGESEEGLLF